MTKFCMCLYIFLIRGRLKPSDDRQLITVQLQIIIVHCRAPRAVVYIFFFSSADLRFTCYQVHVVTLILFHVKCMYLQLFLLLLLLLTCHMTLEIFFCRCIVEGFFVIQKKQIYGFKKANQVVTYKEMYMLGACMSINILSQTL